MLSKRPKSAEKQRCTEGGGDVGHVQHLDNEWNICVIDQVSNGDDDHRSITPEPSFVDVPDSTVTALMADLQETQRY